MFNIQKTKQEIVKDEIININRIGIQALRQLRNSSLIAYNAFWDNPRAKPQEICDALGTDAYKLFQSSHATQQFIKALMPEHKELAIPEDKEVVFNKDGTVTITDKLLEE